MRNVNNYSIMNAESLIVYVFYDDTDVVMFNDREIRDHEISVIFIENEYEETFYPNDHRFYYDYEIGDSNSVILHMFCPEDSDVGKHLVLINNILKDKKNALLNLKHPEWAISYISYMKIHYQGSMDIRYISSTSWSKMIRNLQMAANIADREIHIKHPITKKAVNKITEAVLKRNKQTKKKVKEVIHNMKSVKYYK